MADARRRTSIAPDARNTFVQHHLNSLRHALHAERGAFLAEALILVTIFTLLGTAVMTSVSASGSAAKSTRVVSTADTLASNQLQAILPAPYEDPPHTFSTIAPPPGYALMAQALEYVMGDTSIARIVIVVSKDGAAMTTLESLRLKDV